MWGNKCPLCGKNPTDLLGTTNEWKNNCKDCDIRFNDNGVVLCKAAEVVADGNADYIRMVAYKV